MYNNFILVILVVFMKVDKNLNNKDCICIVSYFLEIKRILVKLIVYCEYYNNGINFVY